MTAGGASAATARDGRADVMTTAENMAGAAAGGDMRDGRLRSESLGEIWLALTGMAPAALIPQAVATVLHCGLTRPSWQWKAGGREYVFLAWPKDEPLRAGVLMGGEDGQKLSPVTAVPILEGLPNDLSVDAAHPREEGLGADVAVTMQENMAPMWFYDPFYGRDRDDLTPGVTHTFNLGAVALAVRKALLDDLTLTSGPHFEAWAAHWLEDNPGMSMRDVPPLKVPVAGRHLIMPGRFYCQYQIRATIEEVDECMFEKMPVRLLYLKFPFDGRPDMRLPVYASRAVLRDYEPEKGQEIDSVIWLQGRIIDMDGDPA